MRGRLTISVGRSEVAGEVAVVPPYVSHSVESEHPSIICLVIEPESVPDGAFDELSKQLLGPERDLFARRIRAAYAELLQRQCRDDITSAEFDRMCFGAALPRRRLDPRVVRAIAQIGRFCGEPVTAASCAIEAGLSPSRFLHLFKQETGISFRSFRAITSRSSRASPRARQSTRSECQAGTVRPWAPRRPPG